MYKPQCHTILGVRQAEHTTHLSNQNTVTERKIRWQENEKGKEGKKKRKLRKKKRGANSPKNVTINTPSLITQQAARARRSDTGNAKTKTKQKPAVICFFALALSPYIFPFHLFISLFLYLFTLVYSIFIFILHFKDQLLRAPSVGKHNSTRVDEGRKSWNLLARHEP